MGAQHTEPLQVEVESVDSVVVLRLVGEVDIASVAILQEPLHRLLGEGQVRLVVVLEELSYLDSTGLGCVTAARRAARDAGGDLVLVCTRPRVLRLFTITGLDKVFRIVDTVEEAVALLAESPS